MHSLLRKRLGRELEDLSHQVVRVMGGPAGASPSTRGMAKPSDAVQARIRLLGQLLAGLSSVDANAVAPDRIGFGSTVRVRDRASGAEEEYTLLLADVMEVEDGQVSLESPIGSALLGRRAGEEVTVSTPRGVRKLEIVSAVTLAQALGLTEAESSPESDGRGARRMAAGAGRRA